MNNDGGMTNRFSGSMLMVVLMCLSGKWQHLTRVREPGLRDKHGMFEVMFGDQQMQLPEVHCSRMDRFVCFGGGSYLTQR